jgi:arabinogalactan endo-1,4-beta-galactosidase
MVTTSALAQPSNLLRNSGFESTSLSAWRFIGGADIVTSDPVDGERSVRLRAAAKISQLVRLAPGIYELRAFIQAEAHDSAALALTCDRGLGTTTSTDIVDPGSPPGTRLTSDWVELHAGPLHIAATTRCVVSISASATNTFPVLADDVWLTRHVNLLTSVSHAWTASGPVRISGDSAVFGIGTSMLEQRLHLPPGAYTFSVSYRSSGDQTTARLETHGCSDVNRILNLAPAKFGDAFRRVQLRGFPVTRATCTVGIRVRNQNGQWLSVKEMRVERAAASYDMIVGGDVSLTDMVEQHGGVYRINGKPDDPFRILAANGMNLSRIHLFVDPGNPAYSPSREMGGNFDNLEDALHLAARAHAAGMLIELSLHLSDHWADPQCQSFPHAWLGLDADALVAQVRAYVSQTLRAFAVQATPVDLVAIGNEADPGVLRTETCKSGLHKVNADVTTNPDLLARIYQAGYEAAHATQPNIRVLWHLANIGRYAETRSYLDGMFSRGARVDVLGYSAYPFWSRKTVRQFQDFANYVIARYNKPVFFEETGYPWAPATGSDNMTNCGPETYPLTPQGQLDFLNDEISAIESADNAMVIGFSYWDATWIPAPGAFDNVDNYVLFDRDGNALPALTVGFKRSLPEQQ